MTTKLKSFIEESFVKIKKAKKSPKNFWIERNPENGDDFIITKNDNKNFIEPEDWLGNLAILYDNRNITSENVEKSNELKPKKIISSEIVTVIAAIDPIKVPDNYSVYLSNYNGNDNKLDVLKAVKVVTGLGLKETKDLIDRTPTIVLSNVTEAVATSLVADIVKAGGTANVSQDIQNYTNNSAYNGFNIDWIPFIQAVLRIIFLSEIWVYEDMDNDWKSLISLEEFNNLVNYTK